MQPLSGRLRTVSLPAFASTPRRLIASRRKLLFDRADLDRLIDATKERP